MAKSDPAHLRRINNARESFQRNREHLLESCMHDERFVILDQELIKLNPILGMKCRNAKNVRGYFIYLCLHLNFSFYRVCLTQLSAGDEIPAAFEPERNRNLGLEIRCL